MECCFSGNSIKASNLKEGFPGSSVVKNPPANAGNPGSIPRSRRTWIPTPVFLPGKSHGQKSLEGYSPQGHKELDTTEHACMNTGLQRCQGPKGTKG